MREITIYKILDCTEVETLHEMAFDIAEAAGGRPRDMFKGWSVARMRHQLDNDAERSSEKRATFIYKQGSLMLRAIEHRLGELYLRRLRPSTREEAERNEKRLHEGRH